MDRETALSKADQLTREAAERGAADRYWIEIELPSGEWTVEERPVEHRGVLRRIWEGLWQLP